MVFLSVYTLPPGIVKIYFQFVKSVSLTGSLTPKIVSRVMLICWLAFAGDFLGDILVQNANNIDYSTDNFV